MSGVNLNNTEARFAGTTCGGGKRGNDVLNAIDRKRSRHRIAISERQRARRNDIAPTPFALRNRSVACPRRVSARLATGMRQLHPSHAAFLMNKPDDSSQRVNVIIHPDAQVLRTDPALGKNGRCFGKHQASTAYCPAAQMHEMPVARVPVRAGVLAHRRNKYASDWHFVHLGSRAVGGAGLVLTEATAVLPEGRISPQDLGIWSDDHIEPLARIVSFIHEQGSVAGMQLAHAGRKASTSRPWEGQRTVPENEGGWKNVMAPSAIPFADNYPMPQAVTPGGIQEIIAAFANAARRACEAGFRVIEIHAAHGYLIHEFLSPLSNRRDDAYGGSLENRTRLCREIVAAVRSSWPERAPFFVRLSATDWIDGGWDIEQSIELARGLRQIGVDLVDCSSGGSVPHAKIPAGPGYQTPFAQRIRREAEIMTGAVGMITSPVQAEQIVGTGQADVIVIAREFLRDPYWPLRAAKELGQSISWPVQYLRAAPKGAQARVPVNLKNLESCFEEQHAIPGTRISPS